jgi:hypothetical protein
MKMLKIICFVTVAAGLLAAPVLAGPLGKTVKGGISYAKVTNDVGGDSDSEMGYVLGLAMTYDLIPGLSLQPELLYVQQGGKYDIALVDEGGMPVGNGELIWDLDYIQVPVLARISLPLLGTAIPTIIAGPALAFNLSSDYTQKMSGEEVSGNIDDISSTDLSLIIGAGMKLGAGPAGAILEVRYNHGLTNLNDSDGPAEIKNRSIQAMAGFSF